MIHSSHRDRKTKAIAEVLAMIPDLHPELVPHRPRPVCETDEWLWESATEFCAARLAGGGAETARLIVEGVARAVHGGDLPAPESEHDAAYDSQLVIADCDLAALTADLLRPEAPLAVSFFLSGPPGTGKSAYLLSGVRINLPHQRPRLVEAHDW